MVRGARFSQKRVFPAYQPRLLGIPAELRTQIYDLVVTDWRVTRPPVDKLFAAARKAERKKDPYEEPETVLALARVCKQLHNEVLPVYYGNNRFEFSDAYDLYRYLHMIGPERRALIQQITFAFEGNCRRYAFELLGECASLRHLEVLVTRSTTKGCRHPQKDVFSATGLWDLDKALFRLPINLKLDVKEAGEEYFRELYARKYDDALMMTFVYRQHFGEDHINRLQDLLRSAVAKIK